MNKILVLSPHADDEVLGCGGFLAKFGRRCFVYYVGVNERFEKDSVGINERITQIKKVANFLGFEWECNEKNIVNQYDEKALIGEFEKIINRIKPDTVIIPHPSYNQDHRAVYNAALVALRPHDKNHFVPKVLEFEQDQAVIWDRKPINPNYFVKIDIDKKLEAYRMHEGEVRAMRSPEMLRAIAKLRGSQVGVDYAEGFLVLRWVE